MPFASMEGNIPKEPAYIQEEQDAEAMQVEAPVPEQQIELGIGGDSELEPVNYHGPWEQ